MTLAQGNYAIPAWDSEQREVISDHLSSWQLVIAGPGCGKSAVACQRVAHLVDLGIPPPRILLVSFTRTAVAELRNRIVSYAVAGEAARAVRISTIDSHAWSLRNGFDDGAALAGSYDVNIEGAVAIFREGQPDLIDFMSRLQHLIIDEAQDVLGSRADLILEMLRHVSSDCGVTILADPAQAIYGFTQDGKGSGEAARTLLDRLESESRRPFTRRYLARIHRIQDPRLVNVFQSARGEIEGGTSAQGHIARVQQTIRGNSNDAGPLRHDAIPEFLSGMEDPLSTLLLFRRRADVLVASSYCSGSGIEHRLRLADAPTVIRPWLGWLFGEYTKSVISRSEFAALWEQRSSLVHAPFAGEDRDKCWAILHALAAGKRLETVDVADLRRLVARARPPIELCHPDLGYTGPIMGTIHASKGREADTVILFLPTLERGSDADEADEVTFEEGRVYYVGATRARKVLVTITASSPGVGYLKSGRIFRRVKRRDRAQLEVGRDGDVDFTAHLSWPSALETQRVLATCVGATKPAKAVAAEEHGWDRRIYLGAEENDAQVGKTYIGQLSDELDRDVQELWGLVDKEQNLRPAQTIPHLYLVGITSVGIPEDLRDGFPAPFDQSGVGLAPVVKGFPLISFVARKVKRRRRR